MKRAAIFLGIAGLTPLPAEAQIPVAPKAEARTPAPEAPPPPATSAAKPAPATPAPTAPAAAPAPATPAAAAPGGPAAQPPGDEYFVEPPAPPEAPGAPNNPEPAGDAPPFEPPPPPMVMEPPPPPPPQIRHVAPERALVLGARVGWFIPFGNLFARADAISSSSGTSYVLHGVPWSDYASSGPMFELDAGVRLSRAYTLFALWERAQLGSGAATGTEGGQKSAESDFFAGGLRASSNPDHLGFLTEVAIGYRRARTFFKDGFEYQFTDAPFEARLGLGAELRLNRMTSLSGLFTIGVGSFGELNAVAPNGNSISLAKGFDQGDGHAWATITVGGHFDLLGSRD